MSPLELIIYYAGAVALACVAAYLISRVASFAHYKSKFEHFMRVKREIGGPEDGEEV